MGPSPAASMRAIATSIASMPTAIACALAWIRWVALRVKATWPGQKINCPGAQSPSVAGKNSVVGLNLLDKRAPWHGRRPVSDPNNQCLPLNCLPINRGSQGTSWPPLADRSENARCAQMLAGDEAGGGLVKIAVLCAHCHLRAEGQGDLIV